ncbi:MAG: O-acetyl-ADP-ribose deacetylase [Phycisphaerae bacterium]|nr:O-acetyl-ADP-ribose deacetylase [Phycisphaerae bacterium]
MPANVWARIELHQGDITRLDVDVIVNAANARLAGGGGVDGAIHRAAGPSLLNACLKLGGCPTGDAKITPGFNLPARHIIHAVGPIYHDGTHDEPALLASCYRRSLEIAVERGLKTIAFSAISTGIYGFPFEPATRIALRTTARFLEQDDSIQRAIFVFFGDDHYQQAERIYAEMSAS